MLSHLNEVQKATIVWLVLMLATIVAALTSTFFSSSIIVLFVSVVILIVKGQMIVDYSMALKHVAKHWRRLMSAYCLVISIFVVIAYFMGMSV